MTPALRVMRTRPLHIGQRGVDHRPVLGALRIDVDDREEVAVLPVRVAGPDVQIVTARERVVIARAPQTRGERGGDGDGDGDEWSTAHGSRIGARRTEVLGMRRDFAGIVGANDPPSRR